MRRAGYWSGIGILVFIFALISYSMIGHDAGGILPAGEVSMGEIAQRIQKVSLISLDGERETLWVTADVAEFRNRDASLYLREMEINRISDDAFPLKVTGEYGVMDMGSHNLRIGGEKKPVVVRIGDRYRVETPRLDWIDSRQEVRTDEKIHFIGPRIRIEGKGFTGDVVKGEYEILQSVYAVLQE